MKASAGPWRDFETLNKTLTTTVHVVAVTCNHRDRW